jgi:hypothetical protein
LLALRKRYAGQRPAYRGGLSVPSFEELMQALGGSRAQAVFDDASVGFGKLRRHAEDLLQQAQDVLMAVRQLGGQRFSRRRQPHWAALNLRHQAHLS